MDHDVRALCRVLSRCGIIVTIASAVFLGLLLIPPYSPTRSILAAPTAAALLLAVAVTWVSREKGRSPSE